MPHSKRIARQGTCAYCGSVGDVTEDHVIPQCLWGDTLHGTLLTVDACPRCNNVKKSENDAYLRDLLIVDQSTAHHAVIETLVPKFTRSVGRGQSFLARDIRDRGKKVTITRRRPSGLFTFNQVTEVVEERTREILSLIIRGLHHCYLDKPLPKDTSFWISRLQTKRQIEMFSQEIAAFSGEYHKGEERRIDDGSVFSCSYVELVQSDHTTLWQLKFYGNVVFGVGTNMIIRKEIASTDRNSEKLVN